MALPKWTDERTSALESFVGDESPVSQATVANAAEELETSVRSVSSKLRKMGYDVELASLLSFMILAYILSCFIISGIKKLELFGG